VERKVLASVKLRGHNVRHIAMSPDNAWAYVPNIAERGRPATRDNIDQGWVVGNRLSRVPLQEEGPREAIALDPRGKAVGDVDGVAVSPDGLTLAIATPGTGDGEIEVYDLMVRDPQRKPRVFKSPLPRWTPPAGMTWGPNGTLAAYFELEGNGVLYHFQLTAPNAPLHTHVFRGSRALMPAAPAGGSTPAFAGRSLEFVSPNEWLVFGRQLIDVETCKALGELGVGEPRAQRVVDKDTVLILSTAPNGTERLTQVDLKAGEVLAKRNEVRGIKAPGK
jgi:hypothetical protein